MTGQVAQALVAAQAEGVACDVASVGDIADIRPELVQLAETPIGPLAAAALVDVLPQEADTWAPVAIEFAARLRYQRSYLALQDILDLLLDDPIAAKAMALSLHTALINGHHDNLDANPLLAAAHLEGALRLAIAGVVRPYRVLDGLTDIAPTMPEEYLERLPRLIGVALDAWDTDTTLTEPLTRGLGVLRDLDVSAADAAYELACVRMRAALRQADPVAASDGLLDAAGQFAFAHELDDSRDDAAAYAAVCNAIPAFGAAEQDRLTKAADVLETVMQRRTAWTRNVHQPTWRRPKLDAEVEWLGIVLDLRQATARLAEPSWLEASAAVGHLARAYTAERSTTPAAGLAAVVRPAIENPIAANAVLIDQLTRTIEADRLRDQPTLPPAAGLLLQAVRERRPAGVARDHHTAEDSDAEGDEAVDDRIARLVPRLGELGDDTARAVARHLSDVQLAELEQALAAIFSSGISEHPVLGPLRDGIVTELEANPQFHGKTRAAVIALLDRTLTFLRDRYEHGGALLPSGTNILRLLDTDEKRPVEKDLQSEFYVWVANSEAFAGRATCEMSNIALGRVDVIVRIGELLLVTEVKRELLDASPISLDKYLPQSAAYSGGNIPFSQLLVLDLTDHAAGVPPLGDLAWVREHRARADASPQHVVVTVVVGNRPTPRQLSDGRLTSTRKRRAAPPATRSVTQSPMPDNGTGDRTTT